MQAKAIHILVLTLQPLSMQLGMVILYHVSSAGLQPGIIYFRAGMGVFGKHKKAFKYRFLFPSYNLINHQISC